MSLISTQESSDITFKHDNICYQLDMRIRNIHCTCSHSGIFPSTFVLENHIVSSICLYFLHTRYGILIWDLQWTLEQMHHCFSVESKVFSDNLKLTCLKWKIKLEKIILVHSHLSMCESKSTYLTDTAPVFNWFTYLHVQWSLVKPDTFILN